MQIFEKKIKVANKNRIYFFEQPKLFICSSIVSVTTISLCFCCETFGLSKRILNISIAMKWIQSIIFSVISFFLHHRRIYDYCVTMQNRIGFSKWNGVGSSWISSIKSMWCFFHTIQSNECCFVIFFVKWCDLFVKKMPLLRFFWRCDLDFAKWVPK